jgi:hypothetical protein
MRALNLESIMIDIAKNYTTRSSGDLRIIKYINKKNVTVEFLETGYITVATSINIKQGMVKDLLSPSVCGVGFVGGKKYKCTGDSAITRRYKAWNSMIARCYSEKHRDRYRQYNDCTVCEEWHNFQNFAKWYDKNYIQGYELDKDIKIDGNRIYSPETCMFVSKTRNIIKARAKHYELISPEGELVKIYNLADFCAKNNLSQGCLHHVRKGKRKSHKGWSYP